MKVCTCCHYPELITDRNPFRTAISGAVIVPDDTPVHPGGMMGCGYIRPEVLEAAGLKWEDLKGWCDHDGQYISGDYDTTATTNPELQPWERALNANERVMLVPYLKARESDATTLGTGLHIERQASVLLKAFDHHVLGGQSPHSIKFTPNEFPDLYPRLKHSNSRDLMSGSGLGFDCEGIEKLRDQVAADQAKLATMGLESTSDDEQAMQYRLKVRNSLQSSLHALQTATKMTRTGYDVNAVESLRSINSLIVTFSARHDTDQQGIAVSTLTDILRPVVVGRLVQAGFADTRLEVRWDYHKEAGLNIVTAKCKCGSTNFNLTFGEKDGTTAIPTSCTECQN